MAYRLRKRIKIAPGIYLNASTSGLSASVGPSGASLNFGSRGIYANTKVPGLPLHQRQQLAGGARPSSRPKRVSKADMERSEYLAAPPATAEVGQDGAVILKDATGNPLDARRESLAWKYSGEQIMAQVSAEVESRTQQVEALGKLHLDIPSPIRRPAIKLEPFDEIAPVVPARRGYHWFWKLFPFHRRNVDSINVQIDQTSSDALTAYESRQQAHEANQAAVRRICESRDSNTHQGLEHFLEWHLPRLTWPRETLISFELSADCKTLWFDIDLPEIEDMPDGQHEMSANGKKIRWKAIGEVARRKMYMAHIHGIGLRLIGEGFAHCPTVETVVAAGYSQRRSTQTASIENEYLFSSMISRAAWSVIRFDQLEHLDPIDAYDRFDTRRKMTATGVFKPIEPHVLGD